MALDRVHSDPVLDLIDSSGGDGRLPLWPYRALLTQQYIVTFDVELRFLWRLVIHLLRHRHRYRVHAPSVLAFELAGRHLAQIELLTRVLLDPKSIESDRAAPSILFNDLN